MKTKVFLSGGLSLSDCQSEVINKVGRESYIYFNPRMHLLNEASQYSIWDLHYVEKCDILFAYMQKENPSGFGLTLESGYASALGKPIILIDEKSISDKEFCSRFKIVREIASIVFDNLEEGIDFLKKMRNGILL